MAPEEGELLAQPGYATDSGGTASCRSSCPPSPRLAWLTILRWWLPHIDESSLTKPSHGRYRKISYVTTLVPRNVADNCAASQQNAQMHALRFGSYAEQSAERSDPIAHALHASSSTRYACRQTDTVVANIQQCQRHALTLADTQAQLECIGVRMLDGVGRALLHQAIDHCASVVIEQAWIAVQLGAIGDASSVEQIANRAFIQRAQQSELIEYGRAQIVQQAMQRASHVTEDGVDRDTDVVHASLGQARLRELQMGLDRGEVLAEFVVEFGGHVATLIFLGLQVAACRVAKLACEMVQAAIDGGEVDILFGHALAAAAQRIRGRAKHQGARASDRQEQFA